MKLVKSVALIVAGVVIGALSSAAVSAVQTREPNAVAHPLTRTATQLNSKAAGYSFISDGGNGCWLLADGVTGPALAVAPAADCR